MTTGAKLKLHDGTNTFSAAIKAQDTALAADITWTLPAADGTAGQALVTDGSTTLGWASTGASTAVVMLNAAQLAAQTSVEIVPIPSAGQYLLPTEVEALFTYGSAIGKGDVTLKYSTQTLSTLTNLLSNTVNKQVAQNVHSLTPENSALYVKAALGFLTTAFGGINSGSTSIAIDSTTGVPYVAFTDGGNNSKSTVYKLVSGTWTLVGAAFGGINSQFTSIAINSSGVPYVAFQDGGNSGKPTVYKLVSGTWTLVGAAFGGNFSQYTSIAIDSTGVPYVTFTDSNNSNKPTVYKFNGVAWILVGAAFGGGSNFTSIAIDSTGVPYVAFTDGDNTAKVAVYKLVSGTWTLVGAVFGDFNSNFTSIAIDSTGVPYVAFTDITNTSTVYKFNGVAWTLVDAAFGGNNSQYTSIAIDSAGAPYVAFTDGGNNYKSTVAALTAPAGATVKLRVSYQVLSLLT